MKWCIGWMVLILGMAAFAALAPGAEISDSGLDAMGLGGMTTMSDTEGMEVRGMGYYGFGSAYAAVSGFVSVHAPGVYIYEQKAAHATGRNVGAQGGFTVTIQNGCNFLSISEVGFATAYSR